MDVVDFEGLTSWPFISQQRTLDPWVVNNYYYHEYYLIIILVGLIRKTFLQKIENISNQFL